MIKTNCIITGGAGFVGSNLAGHLIKHNVFDKVFIVDNLVRTNGLRNIAHLLRDHPSAIEFIHGDASWFDFTVIKNVTHMFHLAATRINRCVTYPREGHTYIADSGFNVVKYCAENKVALYFASSASVYASPKRFPIFEDDPCVPPTLYGSSKLYTEHIIRNFAKTMGLDYTINRYFSVYGPRMDSEGVYTEVIFNWLNNIHQGKLDISVFGNPDEKVIDLVFVDDVVDAIMKSCCLGGIYNVSTESGTTLTELIRTIQLVTGKSLSIHQHPETRSDIEAKRVGSNEKLRGIGWRPDTTLEDGIRKTYEWITTLERT
jgi:UDP-glucose 4-epimerase